MRTTVTLEPDTDAIVRRLMRDRKLSFKQALNEAIRAGARPATRRLKFRTKAFDMGSPALPLDKALRLAAELEDEEIIRKLAVRK
ncbi:MAG: antitoxin [Chloroflexi bacterium]|nr:antitoxin [Chloroflexota bacterium]